MRTFLSKGASLGLFVWGGVGCIPPADLKPLVPYQAPYAPETTTLRLMGYQPAPGKSFTSLFVQNFSVKVVDGVLTWSSARDGFTDAFKEAHANDYGFGILGPRSSTSGFTDLFLYFAGIQLGQQNLLYCSDAASMQSSSSDMISYVDERQGFPHPVSLGLHDCEKLYMGLNPLLFDNDGDGIPDYLEFRYGLNAKNPYDANLSLANDRVVNLEKIKQNLPLDESADSPQAKLFAYQYQTEFLATGTQNITISNIPVLHGGDQNFIAFYLIETNLATQEKVLYTAYSILNGTAAQSTFQFEYWATDPAHYNNQELVVK